MSTDRVENLNSSNTSRWAQLILQHHMIFVTYHSKVDCPVCVQLHKVFVSISNEDRYSDILFLSVDTDNNHIADEYIRRKRLPFFAIFKKGLLIACNNMKDESSMRNMLEKLLMYELKI